MTYQVQRSSLRQCSAVPLPVRWPFETYHKPAYCYRPSLHNQSTLADDPLSPALFTEAVQRCATASQMAVRHLAATALAPLTPPEELAPTLLRLLATATASPAPDLNVVRLLDHSGVTLVL